MKWTRPLIAPGQVYEANGGTLVVIILAVARGRVTFFEQETIEGKIDLALERCSHKTMCDWIKGTERLT